MSRRDPHMDAALMRPWLLAVALGLGVLGSAAAFGVHRFRFFGREAVSFLLVLPIALQFATASDDAEGPSRWGGLVVAVAIVVIARGTGFAALPPS